MLTPKEQFSELLSLTQLYLTREFQLDDKEFLNKQSFRDLKKKMSGTAEPVIKKPEPIQVPISLPIKEAVIPQKLIERPLESITRKMKVPAPIQSAPPPPPVVTEEKHFVPDLPQAPPASTIDLSYKEILKEHFPQLVLSDSIPTDHVAKREKDAWMAKQQILPVAILAFYEDAPSMALLKNIAKAINLRLAPAKVLNGIELEKEQQWETVLSNPDLRFVISGDYGLYLQPGLMKHYHQDPKTGTHYLNRTPLLLLSDISLYLKKPELKALLWNAICNQMGI